MITFRFQLLPWLPSLSTTVIYRAHSSEVWIVCFLYHTIILPCLLLFLCTYSSSVGQALFSWQMKSLQMSMTVDIFSYIRLKLLLTSILFCVVCTGVSQLDAAMWQCKVQHCLEARWRTLRSHQCSWCHIALTVVPSVLVLLVVHVYENVP